MYDLPSEFPGEPGLPDEYHDLQPEFLSATLQLTSHGVQARFTGTDMCLYYDEAHPLWHKRPDWFLAVGVPRLYGGSDLRLSYVVKDEGVAPSVIVELLSPGTEQQDLGPFYRVSDRIDPGIPRQAEIDAPLGDKPLAMTHPANLAEAEVTADASADETQTLPKPKRTRQKPPSKWEVYEEILQVPYYITYSRYTDQMRCFQLQEGRYIEATLDPDQPRFWLPDLNIGLGIWFGEYRYATRSWLRWFDANGQWLPTPEEAETQRANQAEQRAEEQQRLRLELLERLRSRGIDWEQL